MLQIKNISKRYKTGTLEQRALDGVSLNLRDNEFVAVLGPSGSGKTTLLNIIGGLDRYDSGDLIIQFISTKKYKNRDWDAYRNHTIGFVFQSYNLIPHQTILSNVELALTISGVSRRERKRRAKEALGKVGLGEQAHKRPNQLSGGQMQRVAIARALVNDPEILLADEPTGALDSETSIQVMELLKEVAKDRLVVMVTHNPELAEQYATRIVKLKDGKVISDSDPFVVTEEKEEAARHKKMGKTSMSFLTALVLSFNNLRTKKGRTILTAFAGSIGIIGIALILSLSNGVNQYIEDIQKDTMTSYPIMLTEQSFDLAGMMEKAEEKEEEEVTHAKDAVYSDNRAFEHLADMTASIAENNLTGFKKYLDNKDAKIHSYIGENGIVYTYDADFDLYTYDEEGTLVSLGGKSGQTGIQPEMSMQDMTQMMGGRRNLFSQIMPGKDGSSISPAILESYDLLYGELPDSYEEMVLVLDQNNEIELSRLYRLGLLPFAEYTKLQEKQGAGESVSVEVKKLDYEDICQKEYLLLPDCDRFQKDANGLYEEETDDLKLADILKDAKRLKISAILRLKEGEEPLIGTSLGYTRELTSYMVDYTKESEVVKAQEAQPEVNIRNGMRFEAKDRDAKIQDARKYIKNMGISDQAGMFQKIMSSEGMSSTNSMGSLFSMISGGGALHGKTEDSTENEVEEEPSQSVMGTGTGVLVGVLSGILGGEEEKEDSSTVAGKESIMADYMNRYLENPDEDMLLRVYDTYISAGSYEENMKVFGVINMDTPKSISLYADSFEAKDKITECIEEYNKTADENDQIVYTDYTALLMSSITTIVNTVSYILIAFVGVALIVSSIMIGIITYISVLERTKEIGILRAMGASKHNISQVFNAETFIIGLFSGLMGVGITLLLLIPSNMLIHTLAESEEVSASLPPVAAAILVILSVLLTLVGGLIPSRKAARRDPVTALRTE